MSASTAPVPPAPGVTSPDLGTELVFWFALLRTRAATLLRRLAGEPGTEAAT